MTSAMFGACAVGAKWRLDRRQRTSVELQHASLVVGSAFKCVLDVRNYLEMSKAPDRRQYAAEALQHATLVWMVIGVFLA